MTSAGPQAGPQGVVIEAGSRRSFNAGDYVIDYDVSTMVESTGEIRHLRAGCIRQRTLLGPRLRRLRSLRKEGNRHGLRAR